MPVQVLEGGEDLLDRGALMSSVAGILQAQLTQHIALFEKMCGPVKHVRLAVRRRKNGGQGRGRKRKSDERVVVDVASWEEEEVQSFRVVPAGAESSELLARRIKLVKFDERLGAGAEGGSGGGDVGAAAREAPMVEGLLRATRKEAGGERKRAASGRWQCQMHGCSKRAVRNPATRKTEFCIAHGGGPRCQWDGCSKGAKRNPATKKTEFCIAHGGGARCQWHECSKSAVHDTATGRREFCVEHGGGPRCQWPGCSKFAKRNPATEKTEFCIAHGGGPRCQMPGCLKGAKRNPATKKTEFCVEHDDDLK